MVRTLTSFRTPLEPIELPSGHVVTPRWMDAVGIDLVEEAQELGKAAQAEPDVDKKMAIVKRAVEKTSELLKHLYPAITDRDLKYLGMQDRQNLVAITQGNIELMEEELGNASSAGANASAPAKEKKDRTKTNGTTPSPQQTDAPTSAPASRKATGSGSGSSRSNRTRKS
jgi:hypothetical protein